MSVIRGTAMSGFHELVSELGGDSRSLVRNVGIDVDDLGQHDRYIPLRSGIQLLEDAAGALGIPDFGRRLASRQSIDILGAVGLAARSAPSVGDAFDIFDRFMASYSPSISARMVPDLDPALHRFEYAFVLDPAPPQVQADELALGVTVNVLRSFFGRNYRPVSVHVPHAPIGPTDEYDRYYSGPTRFCEPFLGVRVRTADLERKLPTDPVAHQTAMDYLHGSVGVNATSTTHIVLSLLRMLLPTGAVGIADVAGYLGVHSKTLQRRLAAEGETFTGLVDDVRRVTAQRLLLDTDLALDLVCRQVGYAEQSVLTRSCRRWFGMTPTAYRRSGQL